MNAYERLMEIMRTQGKKDNPNGLILATVSDSDTVRIGSLILDSDDYLRSDSITELKDGDTVVMYQISDSQYIMLCKVVV